MNYLDILTAQLRIDEGVRSHPYRDSTGRATIGVGRNLDDVGLSGDEIDLLLQNDIDRAVEAAGRAIPTFWGLSDARKAVVANLAFNIGERALGGFHDMLAAISEERWDDAAGEMLDSKWATQVGPRAQRLAQAMRTG